ncbi:hypothetical protein SERLA73DRAFT_191088 [Serpula lacrymans var. lacrymans S7.3]|uniref:F-box domain-containing protein n=2 Tax=Serpula lacrymans var. lacrymans TaxID=341189 RepID=F8QGW6_SERL3|nr:uncharacterized protein SERLADRAFT_480685 [Serpula lacrymans var. lacrymans S7.9]EGN92448.1 hypothetical protein SERLA73DRAFT_191088 [Serpula lacrymans var. lacrymans S7.3]EGO18575.1 hypothetical protein SERLADRAFT_480685 [Serpula lacrymans var. lacrymans S7.9]
MDLPVEILDKIFGPESGLRLQDHLALSGTCSKIRQAYTDNVWAALNPIPPRLFDPRDTRLIHIFSNAGDRNTDNGDSEITPSPLPGPGVFPLSSAEAALSRQKAIDSINNSSVTAAQTKSMYKLSQNQALSIPYTNRHNPHGRYAAPIRLFVEARVRALAFRIHDGPLGHQKHIKRLETMAEKGRATRERNGTVQVKKVNKTRSYLPSFMCLGASSDTYVSGEEDYAEYFPR